MCIYLQILYNSLKFYFASKQCRQVRYNVTLRRVRNHCCSGKAFSIACSGFVPI